MEQQSIGKRKRHGGIRLLSAVLCLLTLLTLSAAAGASGLSTGYDTALEAVLEQLHDTTEPAYGSIGGEWAVLALARGGVQDDAWYEGYLDSVFSVIDSKGGVLHAKKYTEYSRVIIALSAVGQDASQLDTGNGVYDLVSHLTDKQANGDYRVSWQGNNGTVFGLIAVNARNYLDNAAGRELRAALTDRLLDTQLSGGGWGISAAGSADVDTTAMALQALAPYYLDEALYDGLGASHSASQLRSAVNAALGFLNGKKGNDYGSVETAAQVVTALAALDRDAADDALLGDALSSVLAYSDGNGGFLHVKGGSSGNSRMSTEQAAYALAAYDRWKNGKTALYDMTDVGAVPLTIIAQPADFEGNIGDTAVFSVEAAGEGLSFQWQARTASGTKWNACSGTESSYRVKISAARLGYVYRCVVTDAKGGTLATDEVRMTLPLTIIGQPADFEGSIGGTAVFSVSASGTGLRYQWQLKTSDAAAWKNTTITGYRTDTISVPVTAARLGYRYRCVVTDAKGGTLTSGEARLLEAAPALAITAQPADCESSIGDTAVFSVSASGTGLRYQWQLKTSDAAAWKNTTITGYRTDTISVPVTAARLGYRYRCVITDAKGETLTSGEARLLEAAFAITGQPADFEGGIGDTAVFSVSASGSGLRYQWQARTATGTRWSDCSGTESSYRVKVSAARLGYVYRCVITDAKGETLTTNEVRMLTAGA